MHFTTSFVCKIIWQLIVNTGIVDRNKDVCNCKYQSYLLVGSRPLHLVCAPGGCKEAYRSPLGFSSLVALRVDLAFGHNICSHVCLRPSLPNLHPLVGLPWECALLRHSSTTKSVQCPIGAGSHVSSNSRFGCASAACAQLVFVQ